jgi:hypothetical protein
MWDRNGWQILDSDKVGRAPILVKDDSTTVTGIALNKNQ